MLHCWGCSAQWVTHSYRLLNNGQREKGAAATSESVTELQNPKFSLKSGPFVSFKLEREIEAFIAILHKNQNKPQMTLLYGSHGKEGESWAVFHHDAAVDLQRAALKSWLLKSNSL